jgi:hypothetical protein
VGRLFFSLAIFGLFVFFCLSARGQAPSSLAKEMLQTTYPEEFLFTASPENVWQALSEEIKVIPNKRILVSEADDMVLSWVELPDQTTSALKPAPKPAPVFSASRSGRTLPVATSETKTHIFTNDLAGLRETEIMEVGEDRVAVTTVIVLAAPKGSIVRFRRIYYGSHTQPRIAHSTGAFESWLATRLSKRLAP